MPSFLSAKVMCGLWVFYVVSYLMWVHSAGQGCSGSSTGDVLWMKCVWEIAVSLSALSLNWTADMRVIALTVVVVFCIHHHQSSLFHCLQHLLHSHSILFHSLYLSAARDSSFIMLCSLWKNWTHCTSLIKWAMQKYLSCHFMIFYSARMNNVTV